MIPGSNSIKDCSSLLADHISSSEAVTWILLRFRFMKYLIYENSVGVKFSVDLIYDEKYRLLVTAGNYGYG